MGKNWQENFEGRKGSLKLCNYSIILKIKEIENKNYVDVCKCVFACGGKERHGVHIVAQGGADGGVFKN